jgi:glucokinase
MVKLTSGTRDFGYVPLHRVGIGMSRLGTSKAVAIGIYAFALQDARPPVVLPSIQSIPP